MGQASLRFLVKVWSSRSCVAAQHNSNSYIFEALRFLLIIALFLLPALSQAQRGAAVKKEYSVSAGNHTAVTNTDRSGKEQGDQVQSNAGATRISFQRTQRIPVQALITLINITDGAQCNATGLPREKHDALNRLRRLILFPNHNFW